MSSVVQLFQRPVSLLLWYIHTLSGILFRDFCYYRTQAIKALGAVFLAFILRGAYTQEGLLFKRGLYFSLYQLLHTNKLFTATGLH